MYFVCTAPVLKVLVCNSQPVLERHLSDAAKKGKLCQQKPQYVSQYVTYMRDDLKKYKNNS